MADTNLEQSVKSLEQRVVRHDQCIDMINNQIATRTGDIDALKTQAAINAQNIMNIKENLSTCTDTISELRQSMKADMKEAISETLGWMQIIMIIIGFLCSIAIASNGFLYNKLMDHFQSTPIMAQTLGDKNAQH